MASKTTSAHHFRFHAPHTHLTSVFGDDWFGVRAEAFARFFGTPTFLIAQTVLVAAWIVVNVVGRRAIFVRARCAPPARVSPQSEYWRGTGFLSTKRRRIWR